MVHFTAAVYTQILKWFVLRWQLGVTPYLIRGKLYREVRAHLGVETQRQWSDRAKRESLIRETSRRGQRPETGLLAAAAPGSGALQGALPAKRTPPAPQRDARSAPRPPWPRSAPDDGAKGSRLESGRRDALGQATLYSRWPLVPK